MPKGARGCRVRLHFITVSSRLTLGPLVLRTSLYGLALRASLDGLVLRTSLYGLGGLGLLVRSTRLNVQGSGSPQCIETGYPGAPGLTSSTAWCGAPDFTYFTAYYKCHITNVILQMSY